MRCLIFCILAWAWCAAAQAQSDLVLPGNLPQGGTLSIGSPFFLEQYKYGDILLERRRIRNVPCRVNLYTNQVQFITNGVEAMLQPGMVKEVNLTDSSAEGVRTFRLRTGYPPIENKKAENFYQVLADGKCQLLTFFEKKGLERKNAATGSSYLDFETREEYFVFSKGVIRRLKRDRDFFLEIMADKKDEALQYIETNKLKMGNNAHLVQLVNYYNSL